MNAPFTLAVPSLKSIALEAWEAITCVGMLVFYFLALIVATFVAGFFHDNVGVITGIFTTIVAAAFVEWFIPRILQPFGSFLANWVKGMDREDAWETAHPERPYDDTPLSRKAATHMFGWALFFAANAFVYTGFFTESSAHVVGRTTIPYDSGSHAFMVPFVTRTTSIRFDQTVGADVTGMTLDGHTVGATITARLRLARGKQHLLAFADRGVGATHRAIGKDLEREFRAAVAGYRLEDLSNGRPLIIEDRVRNTLRDVRRRYHVDWNGTLAVADIHVAAPPARR